MLNKKNEKKYIKADISPKKKRNIGSTNEISYQLFENKMQGSTVDATFYATAVLHLCGSMDIQSGIKNFYNFLKHLNMIEILKT